jgi:hypothetical protein
MQQVPNGCLLLKGRGLIWPDGLPGFVYLLKDSLDPILTLY